MGNDVVTSLLPASISDVWTAVGTFFSDGLGKALDLLVGYAIFCAPLILWMGGKVLGMGKGLLKISGRRRG